MQKLSEDEIERWITVKGHRIPVKYGESTNDAIKRLNGYVDKATGTTSNQVTSDFKTTKMLSGSNLEKVDEKVLTGIKDTITDLNKQFPEVAKFIEESGCMLEVIDDPKVLGSDDTIMATFTKPNKQKNELRIDSLNLNKNDSCLHSIENMKAYMKKEVDKGFYMPCAPNKYVNYLAAHEYGHIVQMYLIRKKHDWNGLIKSSTKRNNKYQKAALQDYKEMFNDFLQCGRRNGYFKTKEAYTKAIDNLSLYATKQVGGTGTYSDIFAESFANMVCGKPNEWGKVMKIYLEEEFS